MKRLLADAIDYANRERRSSFYTNQPFPLFEASERDSCRTGRWIFGIGCRWKEMDLAELPSLAGEGNRTLVSSLEGYSFTIKLHPR